MDSEQKDFKAVKVQLKSSQKQGEQLSRSMLYSGINIFGQLSQLYLQNKEAGGAYASFQAQVQTQSSKSDDSGSGSMMHLSQDIIQIFKRLQKKDSTTKIKALQELEKYIEEIDNSQFSNQDQDSDELQNLLTFFLYHFCRIIMNEPDKKVRESAHQAFAQFIKKAKKRIGPHLKKIFSIWYCSFFDVSQEVASLARRNFELAFPENKREQVFKIAYKNFLHFANEQLKQSEDQISDSAYDLSKAQREDVFDRVTSSVLLSLASSFGFIKTWSEEEQQHFKKKLIDILDLNVEIKDVSTEQTKDKKLGKQKISQSYLWNFLQGAYRGRVRSSCLQFISNLLLNLPNDVVQHHINQLSPLVYKLVGEDNSSLQTTLWRDALFTLGKNYPQSWETINIKKDFIPKLYNSLKNSAYGAPSALYENFIKFTSIFPFYHLVDYTEDKTNKASFKERCNLVREAFTTLYQGLKNDESVAFHQDLTKSYYETLSFILWKRVQPLIQKDSASKEDKEFCLDQLKKCIQVPIEDYIGNFEKFRAKQQNERNIRFTIPQQFTKMLQDISERNIDPIIFDCVLSHLYETLNLNKDKLNTVRFLGQLLNFKGDKNNDYFRIKILQNIYLRFLDQVIVDQKSSIDSLSKDNIQQQKSNQILLRLIYKLNKKNISIEGLKLNTQTLQDNLNNLIKKETLASKVLSQENKTMLQQLKDNLVKCVVLSLNLIATPQLKDFIDQNLTQNSYSQTTRNLFLLPQQEFKKLDFGKYFTTLKQDCHDMILSYLQSQIIQDRENIITNSSVISQVVKRVIDGQVSYLLSEDLSTISKSLVAMISQLKNETQLIQAYYSAADGLLSLVGDESYQNLREILFDKLIILRSGSQSYNQLWSIFENVLRNFNSKKEMNYFNYCQLKLKKELKNIIQQNSNYQFETFNRFTNIVKSFVQMCSDKQTIIEEILLIEDNFSNLENNSLPMKMFRDLFLSGGIGFDVTRLFTSDLKYVWLASELLNAKYLPSLGNFLQLKKQLLIFVDTELIPTLINQVQSGNQNFVLQMCDYMNKKASTNADFIYSLEFLVQKMVDPGEDFPESEKPLLKVDEFKQIFYQSSNQILDAYLSGETIESNNQYQIFLKLLKVLAYFITDDTQIQKIFTKAQSNLKQGLTSGTLELNHDFSVNLEIYISLLEYFKTSQDDEIMAQLIPKLQNNTYQGTAYYIVTAILKYISSILNLIGLSEFLKLESKSDFQSFVSQMIEIQREKQFEAITYINLLSLIRKTIGSDLIKDKQLLIDQVIEISNSQSEAFQEKIQTLEKRLGQQGDEEGKQLEEDESNSQIESFEYEMLQELAETLLAFPSYINAHLNEDKLFLLIGSGIESIQKAAFVLLKQLYENFIPQIKHQFDEDDVIKQLKLEQDEIDRINFQKELLEEKTDALNQEEEEEKKRDIQAKQEKQKNKLAFKNISSKLIELIENPPNINAYDEEQKHLVASSITSISSMIFGDYKEGCMNSKIFGYFLAWNALLIKIENGRIKSQLMQIQDYPIVMGALNEYFEDNYEIYQMLLVSLIAYLPDYKKGLQETYNISTFEPEYCDLTDLKQNVQYSVYTLINFMKSFPSLARKYYQECEKQLLDIVLPYIKQIVSPAILDNEIKKIEVAQTQLGSSELSFALYKSTKEITATYSKNEIQMNLRIKIPNEYPLKLVEVDVSKQIKISEKQMRKWILSIRKILQFQNGDIISAVLLWKNNIDKEIEGVEDCYICYCVVHEGDQSLPRMPCKTCKNKFHVACIRKWFRSSNKSNCPICQNYFFA
ncbi:ring zn-finger-domain-containing protein [Stylonychia lemnae]|uniref:E3 ubiquitin-protein ligase listerin n=1 Tax=Stylonychia lemnae TaxID=5949 RepID=A0A077ZPV2_STYLE|nr:ring zn-finger-domain-containing protein [Stylonychia lemnae]|eukprot:CDW71489.1 ring zn-finger-domain-containing protein [Stylonychia lemnae]